MSWLRWVFLALALVGIGVTVLFLTVAIPARNATVETVYTAKPREGEALKFFASYVVPFFVTATAQPAARWGLLIYLVMISPLYLQGDMYFSNPLLAALGYRIFELSREDRGFLLVISRSWHLAPDEIRVAGTARRLHLRPAEPSATLPPPDIPTNRERSSPDVRYRRGVDHRTVRSESRLRALVDPDALRVSLLLISDHRSELPKVYDVPISVDLARELLARWRRRPRAAVDAELQPVHPGFTAGAQQWVHAPIPDGPLVGLDRSVLAATHRQYERDTEFGRRSLLALRLTDPDGRDLARVYQGFSPEKALEHGKRIMAFWNGEQFASLDAQPLVIDRSLRLFVVRLQ